MPDITLVLAVLVGALALAGGGALLLADRAVAPVRTSTAAAPSRVTARRGAVALLVTLVALVVLTVVSNAALREALGDAVFAAPMLAAAIGVGVYGVLQSRPLLSRPAASATLSARRAQDFTQRRTFIATGLLGALLVVVSVLAAAATPVAAFVGVRAVVLLVSLAALVAASVFALRRIAVRAALPATMAAADSALRQAASRFVLLLSSSAVLATTAFVALQAGGWLWENASILAGTTPLTAVGVLVAIVGALAGVGALATLGSVVLAGATQARAAAAVQA